VLGATHNCFLFFPVVSVPSSSSGSSTGRLDFFYTPLSAVLSSGQTTNLRPEHSDRILPHPLLINLPLHLHPILITTEPRLRFLLILHFNIPLIRQDLALAPNLPAFLSTLLFPDIPISTLVGRIDVPSFFPPFSPLS